jgi:hypothetical protein
VSVATTDGRRAWVVGGRSDVARQLRSCHLDASASARERTQMQIFHFLRDNTGISRGL